jgi:hypothetical protein
MLCGGFVCIIGPLLVIRSNKDTDETDLQSLWAVCDCANRNGHCCDGSSTEVELNSLALHARLCSVDFYRSGGTAWTTIFTSHFFFIALASRNRV